MRSALSKASFLLEFGENSVQHYGVYRGIHQRTLFHPPPRGKMFWTYQKREISGGEILGNAAG